MNRLSFCSAGCAWWLVLICCKRKVLLVGWWLVLIWWEKKALLAGWLRSQPNVFDYIQLIDLKVH